MRNFVRKNMHLSCRPSIQQSKRRQALMTANMEEDDNFCYRVLDSEDEWCYDSGMNDVGTSSISINEGDEE